MGEKKKPHIIDKHISLDTWVFQGGGKGTASPSLIYDYTLGNIHITTNLRYMDVFNIAMFIYPALIIIPHTILHVMHKRNLKVRSREVAKLVVIPLEGGGRH